MTTIEKKEPSPPEAHRLPREQRLAFPLPDGRFKKLPLDDSMTNDSFVIGSLTPKQFSKDSGVPDNHDELDRIIRILNPKYNVEESLQEYMDEFEHDEIEDYRDALANDLQIANRLP